MPRKTITLLGHLKDQEISILIDTGSLNNYIHENIVAKVGLGSLKLAPLTATIANGRVVTSYTVYPHMK